jgi:hypothetical protein
LLEEAYSDIGWEIEEYENWVFNTKNWRFG